MQRFLIIAGLVVLAVGLAWPWLAQSSWWRWIGRLPGDIHIEREGFETVGGYVVSQLGRVPAVGEHVGVNGLDIEVLEVERRRIHKVRMTRLQPVEAHERERTV